MNRSKPPVLHDAVDYLAAHRPPSGERCKRHKIPDCGACKNMPLCPQCGQTTANGHVPTEHPEYRKPEVKRAPSPIPPSSIPALSRSTITTVEPNVPLFKERCPHGHIVVNGKPYCVQCLDLGWVVGTFAEFEELLIEICDRASRKVKHPAIPREDRRNHAIISVLMQIDVIARAKKPEAMAWRIAENSIKDLRRRKYWSETQIELYPSDDGELESSDDAMDRLMLKGATTNRGGRRVRVVSEAPERSIKFGRDERRAMANMLADAFRRIPARQEFVLRCRYGFFPECGQLTFKEIAGFITGTDSDDRPYAHFRNQTPEQIRYAVEQGLKNLMDAMLKLMEERHAFLSRAKRKA